MNEVILWRMNCIFKYYHVKSIEELESLLEEQDNDKAKYRIQCDLKRLKIYKDLL